MALYKKWCEVSRSEHNLKRYWTYVERDNGRDGICSALAETIRSHYMPLERVANTVARLGFKQAAKVLQAKLPQTPKARSGDLGEILATELVEEEMGLRVPVRRLRYKDGRDVAMRGDDFIGAGYGIDDDKLWLLKGESKSKKLLGKSTISEARLALDRNFGRCTPGSLLFVADRLLESSNDDDVELGQAILDEVGLEALRPNRIDHMLFTISGNGPHVSLIEDLKAADASRNQYAVNLHIEDHQEFILEMYEKAGKLGDD